MSKISKNKIEEYFELLDQWADFKSADLGKISKNEVSVDILKFLYSELFDDANFPRKISQEKVADIICTIRREVKKYNQQLTVAMVKFLELKKNGEIKKSIEVMKEFISQCKSNFYREIAECELDDKKNKTKNYRGNSGDIHDK